MLARALKKRAAADADAPQIHLEMGANPYLRLDEAPSKKGKELALM